MGSLLTTIAALASSASVLSGTPGRLPAAMSPGPFRLGAPVATLSIPRIHFDGLAHQGIGATQLALGPGHYPSTAFPGEPGTVAFAKGVWRKNTYNGIRSCRSTCSAAAT